MCFGMFKSPKAAAAPPPPPAPEPPPEPLKDAPEQILKARKDTRRRAALLAGQAGTIKTSGMGIPGPAVTTQKTLLGV